MPTHCPQGPHQFSSRRWSRDLIRPCRSGQELRSREKRESAELCCTKRISPRRSFAFPTVLSVSYEQLLLARPHRDSFLVEICSGTRPAGGGRPPAPRGPCAPPSARRPPEALSSRAPGRGLRAGLGLRDSSRRDPPGLGLSARAPFFSEEPFLVFLKPPPNSGRREGWGLGCGFCCCS